MKIFINALVSGLLILSSNPAEATPQALSPQQGIQAFMKLQQIFNSAPAFRSIKELKWHNYYGTCISKEGTVTKAGLAIKYYLGADQKISEDFKYYIYPYTPSNADILDHGPIIERFYRPARIINGLAYISSSPAKTLFGIQNPPSGPLALKQSSTFIPGKLVPVVLESSRTQGGKAQLEKVCYFYEMIPTLY